MSCQYMDTAIGGLKIPLSRTGRSYQRELDTCVVSITGEETVEDGFLSFRFDAMSDNAVLIDY